MAATFGLSGPLSTQRKKKPFAPLIPRQVQTQCFGQNRRPVAPGLGPQFSKPVHKTPPTQPKQKPPTTLVSSAYDDVVEEDISSASPVLSSAPTAKRISSVVVEPDEGSARKKQRLPWFPWQSRDEDTTKKVTPTSSTNGSAPHSEEERDDEDDDDRGRPTVGPTVVLPPTGIDTSPIRVPADRPARTKEALCSTCSPVSKAPMPTISPQPSPLQKKKQPATSGAATTPTEKTLCCDRCDGPHATADCPYFTKERDDHPDALLRTPRCAEMGLDGGNAYLTYADVHQQPGDGSCLFHALRDGYARLETNVVGNPTTLRHSLMDWLAAHEDQKIADTPVSDWVKWDSGCSVAAYAKKMRFYGWGGGIEMAAFAHLFDVEVHVYERRREGGFKRISRFTPSEKTSASVRRSNVVNVLYCGGVHYDSLVPTSPVLFLDNNKALPSTRLPTPRDVIPDKRFVLTHRPATPLQPPPLKRGTVWSSHGRYDQQHRPPPQNRFYHPHNNRFPHHRW